MRSTVKKMYANEFIRGGFFLTTSSFLGNFLNYLFNLISARSLGPANYGELATFFSYSTIIAVPLTVISTVLIQRISASGTSALIKAHEYEYFFFKKIKKWWPTATLILLLSPLMPKATNLMPFTAFALIPFMLLSLPTTFYTAALQGLKFFTLFSIVNLVAVIIKLCGALLVMGGVDGIGTILFFLFLSGLFTLFVGHRALLHKNTEKKLPTNIDKQLLTILRDQQFIITAVSILAITIFNNIDIIFVKKYFLASDVGIYASWSLFAKMIFYSVGPLMSVSFVFFSAQKDIKSEKKILQILLFGLIVVGVVSFFVYTFLGNFLVSIFFGNQYSSVIRFVSKASIFGSFYTAIFFINNYFLAKKSKRALFLPFAVILFTISLYLSPRTIETVINLTCGFSVFIAAILAVLAFIL